MAGVRRHCFYFQRSALGAGGNHPAATPSKGGHTATYYRIGADADNNNHQGDKELVYRPVVQSPVQHASNCAAQNAPAATISASVSGSKDGTEPDSSVERKLVIWLKRIIYRLLAAAVLVSIPNR